jgi:hypothetical protein
MDYLFEYVFTCRPPIPVSGYRRAPNANIFETEIVVSAGTDPPLSVKIDHTVQYIKGANHNNDDLREGNSLIGTETTPGGFPFPALSGLTLRSPRGARCLTSNSSGGDEIGFSAGENAAREETFLTFEKSAGAKTVCYMKAAGHAVRNRLIRGIIRQAPGRGKRPCILQEY